VPNASSERPTTAPRSSEPAPGGNAADPTKPPEAPSSGVWLKNILLGPPRDLEDRTIFHRLSLVAFLAWVGLGADGLSSSSYGPEEAFRTLQQHTYLAVGLMLIVPATVFIISAAYSRIIDEFPFGGGGYVVATKLLGEKAGVVSGCALLVDYVLTITTSIAAAGDALFSFMPPGWQSAKLPFEFLLLLTLTWLNLRGVKESVVVLAPIFILFLLTHAALLTLGIILHIPELTTTAQRVSDGFQSGYSSIGIWGMLILFLHAYSLGGGTFTGIEAVSNGVSIMREPRAKTGKRTMLYMSTSLAIVAAGLLTLYLLWDVQPDPARKKTMNALLLESVTTSFPVGGHVFLIVTLVTEGALLAVAAQAGFLDGPRVLANMAVDSWMPHRFAALSERLTTQNGILLMSAASLGALAYTGGSVEQLVVMYSINVFATFTLSMFGMARSWWQRRRDSKSWKRTTALFTIGFVLTAVILVITVLEKFHHGGWLTIVITGSLVGLCFVIRQHYRNVKGQLARLHEQFGEIPAAEITRSSALDPSQPTAVLLVESYGGLGIHTLFNIFRAFPGHFKNLVFLSVGVIDSGGFKGEAEIEALKSRTEETLLRYVELAARLGIPATYRSAIGTDIVDEAETLCVEASKEFPKSTFFAGKVVFQRDRWYQRLLHNETPFAIQKRLVWGGRTMVVLPVRVR